MNKKSYQKRKNKKNFWKIKKKNQAFFFIKIKIKSILK